MTVRQRIVISVLLATAVVGIVFAFQMHEETEEPVRVSTVRQVFPRPGESMLRQDTIYADLVFPYTGVLVIDGIEISEPQLKRVQVGDATRLSYTPGPNSLTGSLSASNKHQAIVRYWEPERPEAASAYGWEFSVR
jgi:hypothetical protein